MLNSHGAQAVSTAVWNVQTCCKADTSASAPTDQQWICFAAILGGVAANFHDVAASYARWFLL
jgi:hypothetical protein